MSYEETVHDVVKVVEAVGASIMVVGGLVVFTIYVPRMLSPATRPGAYEALRRQLGRCILLGLEVLIVADIVLTIVVEQTIESVVVLRDRACPNLSQLLARGRDGRHVAVEPLASRSPGRGLVESAAPPKGPGVVPG